MFWEELASEARKLEPENYTHINTWPVICYLAHETPALRQHLCQVLLLVDLPEDDRACL